MPKRKKRLFIDHNYKEFEHFVTIMKGHRGLLFCSSFIKKYNLCKARSIVFYTFPDDEYKFAFEFFNEDNVRGSFPVRNADKSITKLVQSLAFVNKIPVLKAITQTEKKSFEIFYDEDEKCFYFRVVPAFENISEPSNIPEGISGIYRYRNSEGEVIYIGKGNIKNRLKSSERNNWGIQKVEYSIIHSEVERSTYESYHIREFSEKNGRKPIYNLIGGKAISNKFSENKLPLVVTKNEMNYDL